MIFHKNRLLADDSHVISCLIFFQKLGFYHWNNCFQKQEKI